MKYVRLCSRDVSFQSIYRAFAGVVTNAIRSVMTKGEIACLKLEGYVGGDTHYRVKTLSVLV